MPTELLEFRRFITEQLDKGNITLTPEDCLSLWRVEHPPAENLSSSIAAVQRAMEQAHRGEGKSLRQFDLDFRQRHGIGKES